MVINRTPNSASREAFAARQAALTGRVAEAAQALRQQGLRPTVARVRAHLGGGSPNDLAPALKSWLDSAARAASQTPTQQSGSKAVPAALPPVVVDLARELWQSALAAATLELKHGPAARELTSRTAEAQALRDQLQGLRQQLERESLAYGELRTLAARHEALAKDALAQLHQAQARERKWLRQLGEARQREAQLQADLQQYKKTAVPTTARHRASKSTAKAERPRRPRDDAFRPPMKLKRAAAVSHARRSTPTKRRSRENDIKGGHTPSASGQAHRHRKKVTE